MNTVPDLANVPGDNDFIITEFFDGVAIVCFVLIKSEGTRHPHSTRFSVM